MVAAVIFITALVALRRVTSQAQAIAIRATLEERRRLARELHDGLAQELSFVLMKSRALAERTGGEDLSEVADAAARALDESRRAIVTLRDTTEDELTAVVSRTAERVTRRNGLTLALDLDPTVEVRSEIRHDLLRILQEALSNATRHGRASDVSVKLSRGEGVMLRVTDNGVGFNTATPADGLSGFGLKTMRERANACGGDLMLKSSPGGGTEVEVMLP
jgi:signal transduction histidine kinase